MAEAVKISNLPAASTVQPTNLIVTVDGAETTTSRATLQQVQDLGPGINTVSDEHVKDGHIPGKKSGFEARERIIVATNSATTSPEVIDGSTTRIQGREILCTEFIQDNIFSCYSATELAAAINSSREFDRIFLDPGTERFTIDDGAGGTVPAPGPSYTWTQDPASGFYSNSPGELCYSSTGIKTWGLNSDGQHVGIQYKTITIDNIDTFDPTTDFGYAPRYGAVAYVSINPGQQGTKYSYIGASQVAGVFGLPGKSLDWNYGIDGNNAAENHSENRTREAVTSGPIYNYLTSQGFQNISANRHNPLHYSWTGVTTNYHSPEDNVHYRIISSGSSFTYAAVAATPKPSRPWIGQLFFESPNADPEIIRAMNIVDTDYDSANDVYTFDFIDDMPDTNYVVVSGVKDDRATASWQGVVTEKATGYFKIKFLKTSGASTVATDPGNTQFDVAVIR